MMRVWKKGVVPVPQWLSNQLKRAFLKKDRRQIRLLNDCWYFYRNKLIKHDSSNTMLK
jgi:hypothetical protein